MFAALVAAPGVLQRRPYFQGQTDDLCLTLLDNLRSNGEWHVILRAQLAAQPQRRDRRGVELRATVRIAAVVERVGGDKQARFELTGGDPLAFDGVERLA